LEEIAMSVRRFINTKVWSDAWIESLDPIEKLVWLYLLTNDYTNMLGIYQVSMKRIIFETGLTQTQITKALKGFESVRKAFYWFDEWIFLPNWIKNQSMNPNMLRSATENFKVLPKHLIDKLKDNGFEGFESLSNGLPTLRNIEVEYEDEIEDESKDEDESEFETFWELYHKETKKPKSDKDAAIKKWNKLNKKEKQLAIDKIPEYAKTNKPEFLKKARTYLGDKNFNDEMKSTKDKTEEQKYIDSITYKG
jgi:hypothetical protein